MKQEMSDSDEYDEAMSGDEEAYYDDDDLDYEEEDDNMGAGDLGESLDNEENSEALYQALLEKDIEEVTRSGYFAGVPLSLTFRERDGMSLC